VNQQIAPLMETDRYVVLPCALRILAVRACESAQCRSDSAKICRTDLLGHRGQTTVDKQGYVRASADWELLGSGLDRGNLREGLHTRDREQGRRRCADATASSKAGALVAAVIPVLQREGFQCVRLDEVRGYDRYKTPPNELGPAIVMAETKKAVRPPVKTHIAISRDVHRKSPAEMTSLAPTSQWQSLVKRDVGTICPRAHEQD